MLTSGWKFSKDELAVEHAAIVAHHRLAAEAGAEIMEQGGNAVDAAVTAAFVMSVVEPFMSGIGGGGYMVIHLAERAGTLVVDFGMKAPAAARPDMFELDPRPATSLYKFREVAGEAKESVLAAAVPGVVGGLCTALERYGTKSRREVMSPAIRLAADGFEMHWFLAIEIYNHLAQLRQWPDTGAVFLKGDGSYQAPILETAGDILKQPDLAQTLEEIAEGGAEAYYRGRMAELAEQFILANGGILTAADFAGYEARIVEPLRSPYRSVDVIAVPDICGGPTVVQSLNLLEQFDLAALGHNSADALHVIAECCRRAFVDRFTYFGDPEFAEVPYPGLLSKAYAAARAAEISLDCATPDVGPGNPWPYNNAGARDGRPIATAGVPAGTGVPETTHISVADEARNLVSLTQTSSNFIVPGTGVMMNQGLKWFNPEPGHPNSIAPGKRLLTNMSPLVLLRGGRAYAAYGSPGSRRIQNSLAQVALNLVDYGLGIQQAVESPKIDCSTQETLVDDRIPAPVRTELRRRGHRVAERHEDMGYMGFARPNGVLVDDEAGLIRAGSYPYFHGVAAGY